jgi:hypothetical protein
MHSLKGKLCRNQFLTTAFKCSCFIGPFCYSTVLGWQWGAFNLLPLWGDGKGSHVKKFFNDSEQPVSRHLTKRAPGLLTYTNKSLGGHTNSTAFEGLAESVLKLAYRDGRRRFLCLISGNNKGIFPLHREKFCLWVKLTTDMHIVPSLKIKVI